MKKNNTSASDLKLVVDYSRSLKEMIEKGSYVWRNRSIAEENFPLPFEFKGKKIIVLVRLFYFSCSIYSDDVIVEMSKAGYRSATLAELLALGESYPELQKELPIVALGSAYCGGYHGLYVPVLDFYNLERGLSLRYPGSAWHGFRFLAVRY